MLLSACPAPAFASIAIIASLRLLFGAAASAKMPPDQSSSAPAAAGVAGGSSLTEEGSVAGARERGNGAGVLKLSIGLSFPSRDVLLPLARGGKPTGREGVAGLALLAPPSLYGSAQMSATFRKPHPSSRSAYSQASQTCPPLLYCARLAFENTNRLGGARRRECIGQLSLLGFADALRERAKSVYAEG